MYERLLNVPRPQLLELLITPKFIYHHSPIADSWRVIGKRSFELLCRNRTPLPIEFDQVPNTFPRPSSSPGGLHKTPGHRRRHQQIVINTSSFRERQTPRTSLYRSLLRISVWRVWTQINHIFIGMSINSNLHWRLSTDLNWRNW